MVQPANRERPEQKASHQQREAAAIASEAAPARPTPPMLKDLYRLPNLAAHVIIQELASSQPALAKEAIRKRRQSKRERRYPRPEDMDLRLLPLADTIRVVV